MELSMIVSRLSVSCMIFVLGVVATSEVLATSRNGFTLDDASIPVDEIMNGGPGRGGIPAINRPRFVTAKNAGFLRPEDRILGVSLDGISRAYPIKILN